MKGLSVVAFFGFFASSGRFALEFSAEDATFKCGFSFEDSAGKTCSNNVSAESRFFQ
jgi:hypothetical protein